MSLTSLARVKACLAACQNNQDDPMEKRCKTWKSMLTVKNSMRLQSFWALLCIYICLKSDVNAKKACDRKPWIPLAKYCPLWLQPFHSQLHFSDGRLFSPSWLPSHAWAKGCRSLHTIHFICKSPGFLFHRDFRTKTIKEVKLPQPRSYCRRSPWQVLRLWRMHGELAPGDVELETRMLEVRKIMGTTEHARQCHFLKGSRQ